MFKIKRPVIVGLLLVLLIFTGYLNYELTQQALRKTSKDYQRHEDLEKAKHNQKELELAQDNEFDITDPVDVGEEKVSQVVNMGNETIDKAIDKEASSSRNYFVEYRLSRDKLRANLVDRLDDIVKNEYTKEDVRTEAQEEIIKIGKNSEKELQVEGLIKSKGFDEVLAFLTDDDIKIVVSAKELTEQDMVKILNIVTSETKFDANSIKISKK